MLQIFKNNRLHTTFFLFLYAGAFFLSSVMTEQPAIENYRTGANFLFLKFYDWVEGVDDLEYVLTFSLLFVQALMLNNLAVKYLPSRRVTYVTAACYITLLNSFDWIGSLNPGFVANTFLILGLYSLYRTWRRRRPAKYIYNSGLCIGIVAWCCFPMAVYSFGLLIGLIITRRFKWQEIFILLTALCTPFFLAGTYSYLTDSFFIWWQQDIIRFFQKPVYTIEMDWRFYAGTTIGGIILLGSFTRSRKLYQKTTVRRRKALSVIFIFLLASSFSFYIQFNLDNFYPIVFTVPLAILLSINLQTLRSKSTSEFIYLAIFLTCIVVQYGYVAELD